MSKRLTIDDIRNYVKANTKCELISTEYKDYHSKLIFTCDECGKEFTTTFGNFTFGKTKCNDCKGHKSTREKQSLSYDYVYRYIKDKNCELISKEYINSNTKLEIKCGECNNTFFITFTQFKKLKKFSCPDCRRKYNFEYVKNYIESHSNCILLSTEYNTENEDLRLRCSCGNEFYVCFTRFRRNNKRQCNECSDWKRWDIDSIRDYVTKNTNCKLLSTEYSGKDGKIRLQCECGNEFETLMNSFFKGNKRQCNECGHKSTGLKTRLSHDEVAEYIRDFGCELLSKYKGSGFNLRIKCGTCGKEFTCTWDNFKKKPVKACPKCTGHESAGEKTFEKLLKEYKIKFKKQYTFDDCRDKDLLRFDFCLKFKKKIILVEIDGENHRKAIEWYGGEEAFQGVVRRDKIKNNYCKNNNIPLIRIEYNSHGKIEYFTELCKNEIKNILLLTQSTT